MLGNAAPTPYDLRFSLFGIPSRVHPLFWVVSVLGGWYPEELSLTALWVACLFFSILIHELGHALTARRFGMPPEIVLYAFGGYASFVPTWSYTMGRAILILLAGPGAGFVLYGVVFGVHLTLQRLDVAFTRPDVPFTHPAKYFFIQMEYINLWWGLVNLLPVYPLDGGQITRELFTHWQGHRGRENSLKLSVLTAIGFAVFFYTRDFRFAAILFAVLAVESYQAMQQERF